MDLGNLTLLSQMDDMSIEELIQMFVPSITAVNMQHETIAEMVESEAELLVDNYTFMSFPSGEVYSHMTTSLIQLCAAYQQQVEMPMEINYLVQELG